MCGIAGVIGPAAERPDTAREVIGMLERIRSRGESEYFGELAEVPGAVMGSNRLSIVERATARQPARSADGRVHLVHNGEVYNFERLRRYVSPALASTDGRGDGGVVADGLSALGLDVVNLLDGEFAFAALLPDGEYVLARDPLGVKPLYYVLQDSNVWFASEMKCLLGLDIEIQELPPGCVMTRSGVQPYFVWGEPLETADVASSVLRFAELFEQAVAKRVATDLPVGVVFSGGIDSAAVLAVANQLHPDITAISVGYPGSNDLRYASDFCAQQGIRQIVVDLSLAKVKATMPDLIPIVETFETADVLDAVSIIAAFAAAREHGFKVVLVGDGSDELLAGYDYFRTHPDPRALSRYRLENLRRTDLQRVDRCSMYHTVEARVPFLDADLVRFAWPLPMDLKLRAGVEKWILREAMRGWLPDELRLRPKQRMPSGMGAGYHLLEHARALGAERPRHPLSGDFTELDYFIDLYLRAGYPEPSARYKRLGWDYDSLGYFDFSNDEKLAERP